MMQRIRVILVKEVIDNLRDRRAWSMSLIFVLMGPMMLMLMISQVARLSSSELSRVMFLPVQGAERAPELMDFLKQRNIEIKEAPADPEKAVRELTRDLVLVVPDSYGEEFTQGRPAPVQLVFDESRESSRGDVRRLREALRSYSRGVGALRLMARGVNPQVVQSLAIEEHNIATPESKAAVVFAVLPMFLMFSLFAGGMYVAIDTMAGERERGSLEPLLVNPITPTELIMGKLGATMIFAAVTALLTSAGFMAVLNVTPADIPGVRIGMSGARFATMLAIVLPLVPAVSALQLLVASMSRTFKEAQTSIQFLIFLPMAPGMAQLFSPMKTPDWANLVPILSQQILLQALVKAEPVRVGWLVAAGVSALAFAAVFALITIRRYDRQRALFGV